MNWERTQGLLLGLAFGLAIGLGALARAATVDDAVALVQNYDPRMAETLSATPVVWAEKYPGPVDASGWTNGTTIWIKPADLEPHNPSLSDRADLAALLVKEGDLVEQYHAGLRFDAGTCSAAELHSHAAMAKFWRWLWDGTNGPSTVYNRVELTARYDALDGGVLNTWYTCAHLFGGSW